MTDRELLELAAKAAGVVGDYFAGSGKYSQGIWRDGENADRICWNPLNNDGDALRLAVKLGIAVMHDGFCCIAKTELKRNIGVTESLSTDPYAATRRAIVRAAIARATHKEGA